MKWKWSLRWRSPALSAPLSLRTSQLNSTRRLFVFRWPICRPHSRDIYWLDLSLWPPEPDATILSSRRRRFRCGPCSRMLCRRFRPCRCRRSVHAAPHLLGRLGWPRWARLHRTARQACSDLRGGSRATNQYHSSDKRLRQCYGNK